MDECKPNQVPRTDQIVSSLSNIEERVEIFSRIAGGISTTLFGPHIEKGADPSLAELPDGFIDAVSSSIQRIDANLDNLGGYLMSIKDGLLS